MKYLLANFHYDSHSEPRFCEVKNLISWRTTTYTTLQLKGGGGIEPAHGIVIQRYIFKFLRRIYKRRISLNITYTDFSSRKNEVPNDNNLVIICSPNFHKQ